MRNQKLKLKNFRRNSPNGKPSGNNPDELLNYSFQIYQLPEDAYSILGFSEQRLSEELKDWTYYNGYSQAVSATFYSDMTIDFNLGSYMMQCVLDDPDQTVITVEYLKNGTKLLSIFKRGE